MRCNQVSICIERFGKYVPKNYPADVQRIHVYCDDFTSVYAALSKAYACAINELNEYDHIGARCDVSTNEFSHVDYREMASTLPISKRSYEEDFDFDYSNTAKVLYEDFIWVYEHRSEILEAIGECESEDDFGPRLKERFGLNDVQIRKLSQIRMDMLTKERYEKMKDSLRKIRDVENRKKDAPKKNDSGYTISRMIYNCKRKIGIIEAYLKAADNYKDIIGIVMDTSEYGDYYKLMEERYGFNREQSRSLRFCCANDFSSNIRENKEDELSELRSDLAKYEKELVELEADKHQS